MYSLVLIMILSLSLTSMVSANVETDKKELDSISDRIDDVKDLLTQGKKKEKDLTKEIANLDKKIGNTESEIDELQKDIKLTEGKINDSLNQMKQTQAEIDDKNEVLNARLRVMYKNGEVGLMEILLGSADFQEFMNNVDMVKRVYEQDVDLLKYLKEKYKEINFKKEQLEQLKYELFQQQANVQTKQKELEVSRGQVAQLRAEVKKDNKALEKQIDELNKYAAELTEKIRKAQSNEAYVGGIFTWPSPGYTYITSPFGYRIHPILKTKKLHTGIDIRVPSNSTIAAANDGTVIFANWNSGYGKLLMIDHGGGIVTLYAHNNALLVKPGDTVKKGQAVAKSGSTGMSTGPHLHFEVRKDGKYVDPIPYLK